jgi:hypothetical protein
MAKKITARLLSAVVGRLSRLIVRGRGIRLVTTSVMATKIHSSYELLNENNLVLTKYNCKNHEKEGWKEERKDKSNKQKGKKTKAYGRTDR